jgi:hypothetical protein
LAPREEGFAAPPTAVSEGDFVSVLQRIHSPDAPDFREG